MGRYLVQIVIEMSEHIAPDTPSLPKCTVTLSPGERVIYMNHDYDKRKARDIGLLGT